MSNGMWWFWAIVLLVVVFPLIGFWVDLLLKENLPKLAEKEEGFLGINFITVKKGRIVAIAKGGNLVKYLANISEQGKKLDEQTGKPSKLEPGEKNYLDSLWSWKRYGVVILWWGKSLYEYPFEKDGKMIPAGSIFLFNQEEILMKNLEAVGGIPIDVKIQVMLETVDAGLALTIPNWMGATKSQLISAIRAWVANKEPATVLKENVEKPGSELLGNVMNLNSSLGNKSLNEVTGQVIARFSVISMDYAENVKGAMEAKAKAEQKKEADLQDVEFQAQKIERLAQANLNAADKQVEIIKKIGGAKNKITKELAEITSATEASKIREVEATADAIKDYKGDVLSLGNGNVPIAVNANVTGGGGK